MAYIVDLDYDLDYGKGRHFNNGTLTFLGDDLPTEQVIQKIDDLIEDLTYEDYIVVPSSWYSSEKGFFILIKNENASWSAIHVALCRVLKKEFPDMTITYCGTKTGM